ncbi:AfsA-related hotdog domain-containing protein [Parachitinimonas caeni]|uniref:AfsA-related hotdog domain-containing protein n=1 Tax=Parachitinimonas caeni TaxID=3031301 RepID=A0ABT7E2Z6_9NEIS|nr:AfsA-related hotdog domain-containing protein [Parachitinimonas caeni]MDK2126680.1 AfsA-related hotdog domain-containing protein [Parachitinimonas caeni]
MKTVVVVGDKFEEFAARQQNVITLRELEKKVWEPDGPAYEKVIVGQGVCRHRLSTLKDVLSTSHADKAPALLNLDQINDQVNPQQQRAVHKVKAENVLISMPRQRDELTYVSKLAIHDAAELLSDHMTGQHVQGMVLTEAARQMMLSVAELYLLLPEERNQRYFVLNEVSSRYHQFAFPIDTEVVLTVLSQERKASGALCVQISVRFMQQDVELAEVGIRYAAYDKHFIAEREHTMAASRLAAYLDSSSRLAEAS